MNRLFAVIFLLITPAYVSGLWEKGFKVRFDVNPFEIGTTSFISLPQSTTVASHSRWEGVEKPEVPLEYSALALWCPKTDYSVCLFFDDAGYVSGLQIALEKTRFSSAFDVKTLGFTDWTVHINGKTKTFNTIQQYYVSTDTIATDAKTRRKAHDHQSVVQDGNLLVTGFNRTIYNISTHIKEFTEDSIYKKQACIPWMGLHYYYNMTRNTPCQANTLFPWFPLVYSNQLIGVGFAVFGIYTPVNEAKYFEKPGKLAAQVIVPRGPECLYRLANSPGLVSLHIYFIENPQLLTCL